jgi:hypothetical protein
MPIDVDDEDSVALAAPTVKVPEELTIKLARPEMQEENQKG